MTPVPLVLFNRWLTLLFAGLLSLGPFLHNHFGTSHETGFHLDGVHAVQVPQPDTALVLQVTDEDSLALGVAASLPHPEDKGLLDLSLTFLLAVLPLLPLLRQVRLWTEHTQHSPTRRYRAGLPPPSLAPPAA